MSQNLLKKIAMGRNTFIKEFDEEGGPLVKVRDPTAEVEEFLMQEYGAVPSLDTGRVSPYRGSYVIAVVNEQDAFRLMRDLRPHTRYLSRKIDSWNVGAIPWDAR